MAVAVGVALVVLAIVLAFFGFITLIFGIGILLLIVALVVFILGIVEIAKGDPPSPSVWGYPGGTPYGHPWYPHPYPNTFAPAYGTPPPGPYGTYPPSAYLAPVATVPAAAPPPPPVPGERYCAACGAANLRASAFCHKCGKPLPPPP